MKIAIITERANISLGGAERSVFELFSQLGLMGLDAEVLAATGQSHSKKVRVLCGEGAKKRADFSVFKRALKKHFENVNYDIIHSTLPIDFADVYQPRGGTYPEAIIRNAASYENPLTGSCKLLTSFVNIRRTAFAISEKRICKAADGPMVAALSEYVKKQLKKHYNLRDERIAVIPNGVKVSAQADTAKVDRLKGRVFEELSIKEADKPVFFVFAANNFRLKGLKSLVRSTALLSKLCTRRNACILVAGRDDPGPYKRLAKSLNVQGKLLFLGPTDNIQNILAISDVAVLPSYYDPASRFILEAIAAGKPVITTKYNGASEMFCNDVHGKIYDSPGDIDSLARAMKCYTDRQNVLTASEAIEKDRLCEKVSIKAHCEKLIELYTEILRRKGQ